MDVWSIKLPMCNIREKWHTRRWWNCFEIVFFGLVYRMSIDAYTCPTAGKNALFLILAPLINSCHGCQWRRKQASRADCRSSLKLICCTKPKTTQASVSGLPKYISHTDVFLSPGPRSYRTVLQGPYWKALMCSCLSPCPASRGVLLLPSPLFEENSLWLPAADTRRQLLVASCWKSLPLFPWPAEQEAICCLESTAEGAACQVLGQQCNRTQILLWLHGRSAVCS